MHWQGQPPHPLKRDFKHGQNTTKLNTCIWAGVQAACVLPEGTKGIKSDCQLLNWGATSRYPSTGPLWASRLNTATVPAADAGTYFWKASLSSHFFSKARNTDIPQRMVIISGISLLSKWLTEFLVLNTELKSNKKSSEWEKKFISLQRRTFGCKEDECNGLCSLNCLWRCHSSIDNAIYSSDICQCLKSIDNKICTARI